MATTRNSIGNKGRPPQEITSSPRDNNTISKVETYNQISCHCKAAPPKTLQKLSERTKGQRIFSTRALQGKRGQMDNDNPETKDETSEISEKIRTMPSITFTGKALSVYWKTQGTPPKYMDTQNLVDTLKCGAETLMITPKGQGVGLRTL